jgi:glyoxylase-like metal-dependent hydrolase (beta-lactamase superfamily II)
MSRKYILAGMVILILVVSILIAHWWPGPKPDNSTPPEAPVVLAAKPTALGSGIFLLGRNSPGAAYAVATSNGLALIDSGIEANAALVNEQLRELGLDPGRLHAILLTHGHADHCLGAERLRASTGAKIYAGAMDCPPLRAGKPREAFFSTFHMPDVAIHPTTIDVELSDGDSIEVGDTRFKAIAAPGHTPGCICFLLERDGKRILFTGDVVQALSGDGNTSLGTYSAYLAPKYRGNAADYLATLRKLQTMPPPDLVLPGHPRVDSVPQSPRIAPSRWQGILDRGITAMEQLLARRAKDGANFLDGNPKQLRPGLYYLGDVGSSAVYCLNSKNGLFLFDAPGGPALVDFLATRLKDLGLSGQWPTAVLLTSTDEEATAGLSALAAKTKCKVVAPKSGLDVVRPACPAGAEILTEDDFTKKNWFDAKVLNLGGRGPAALAYHFRWEETTVFVSGRIPIKLSFESIQHLLRDVGGPTGSRADYLNSLKQLLPLQPDLWLPLTPVQSQNANVYDRDWQEIVARNYALLSQ